MTRAEWADLYAAIRKVWPWIRMPPTTEDDWWPLVSDLDAADTIDAIEELGRNRKTVPHPAEIREQVALIRRSRWYEANKVNKQDEPAPAQGGFWVAMRRLWDKDKEAAVEQLRSLGNIRDKDGTMRKNAFFDAIRPTIGPMPPDLVSEIGEYLRGQQ